MYTKILVPLDFSDVTDRVVDEALRTARQTGAKTWLIHVAAPEPDFIGYEVGPAYIRDSMARSLREQHQRLQQYQERFTAEGLEVKALLLSGVPTRKIVSEMARVQPDLVIIGSHGHGALYHLMMGSVATSIVKHAVCPVLVIPAGTPEERAAAREGEEVTTA
ncbi:MAG: universal stress protein [Planctomycetes bacterium]|nr:universal stress protein [Planctomycetota bacterium]